MTSWLPPALLALFSFGLWGFFSKLAVLHIDSKSALFFQSIGVFLVGLVTLAIIGFKPETEWKGLSYGLLTGIASGIGCLFYLIAANKGKNMTVVTLTSLYPIITIILSYIILREGIQMKQAAGIVFALLALYLLA
jgi:transporter family protein